MNKKIVVFTGAGVSVESGIESFRGVDDGLWYNYDINKVSTAQALVDTPELVYEFHNHLRSKLHEIKPNKAHLDLAELEEHFDVTIITQNVDCLHEKAGSTKVLHLHGELFKSRNESGELFDCLGELNVGDKCSSGEALRPHTVLFDEYPFNVQESYNALSDCDYLIVVGTSLPIVYTIEMLRSVNQFAKVYYVDLNPPHYLEYKKRRGKVNYITETATTGVSKAIEEIMMIENN